MLKIRKAIPVDIENITKLHCSIYKDINESKTKLKKLLERKNTLCVVAEAHKKITGYCIFWVDFNYAYICWIGVSKKHRKRGLATKMMGFIFDYCRKSRIKSCLIDTRNQYKDALFLYINLGFDIIGTTITTDKDLMIKMKKIL